MITDFSPYLKDGVLNLNQEGNKLSGKGKNKCFEDIFDIKQLVKFIQTTPDITEFKATLWGIGKMDINDFRSLMDAIGNSDITALNFENNTLSPEMAEEISKLSKLTELYLGFNKIGDEKITEIVNGLPNLKTLDVSGNDIGKMDINDFRSLMDAIGKSNITALNLAKNTLTSPEMVEKIPELNKLTKLSKLNLGNCNIGDKEIIEIVKGLPNLKELNVENNDITDTGVGAIAKHLPNLLSLNASCNRITDLGAKEIADGLNEIKELILPAYNNISYEGLKKVVTALKDTLIVFDAGFCGCSKLQVWDLGHLLLPNCVLKLGPHWTRYVNNNNEAYVNLDGVVWGNPPPPVDPVGENPPVDLVGVVEGDNNAPALIVPVGENNDAPPLVGVVENLQGE